MNAYILCPESFPQSGAGPLKGFVRTTDITVAQLERFIASHCTTPDGRCERIGTYGKNREWFEFERTVPSLLTRDGARRAATKLALEIRDSFPDITDVCIH